MITTQKPPAPAASSPAKSSQSPRGTSPAAAVHPAPSSGGPDSTCYVHGLETAVRLVESMKLTDEQRTKISQLTEAQTVRCAEARKQHQANHEQILALLTPAQQQTLRNSADHEGHCHTDGHPAPEEHAAHA